MPYGVGLCGGDGCCVMVEAGEVCGWGMWWVEEGEKRTCTEGGGGGGGFGGDGVARVD